MIFLILLVASMVSSQGPPQCQSWRPQGCRRWMSTKTGYTQLVKALPPAERLSVPGCEAEHLWTVVRHGTRYPSVKAIRLMTGALPELKERILSAAVTGEGQLCPQDLRLLQDWTVELQESQEKLLHEEGQREMMLLGERWRLRLPDLLQNYEETRHRLRTTRTQRCVDSGHSFVTGVWPGLTKDEIVWEEPAEGHDPVIRFYKLCQAWVRDVKKNSEANIEKVKFEQSELMTEVLRSLEQVLGFEVSLQEAELMYLMCNFDLAWDPASPSPWCRVFTDRQLQVLEYREDLEYFWIDGPGFEVTRRQSCVLLADALRTFQDIAAGHTKSRGSFYFTHSGALLKLLAFLNVFNDDEPMKSDNFEQMKERKWKTSHIGPFGGNIALVLQKCGDKDFKVGLFVNEVLTAVPGCDGDWCSLERFAALYPSEQCNFAEICDKPDHEEMFNVPDDKY